MSTDEYDRAEKLFCGKWKNVKNENIEAFMAAAEISDAMKTHVRQPDRTIIISREGDSFHFKEHFGDVDADFLEYIGEPTEWEEKEKNPILHIKTIPTFKDGVWIQDCTPLEPGDGKRYIIKLTRSGEELIWDNSLPDVPNVTSRQHWKKC